MTEVQLNLTEQIERITARLQPDYEDDFDDDDWQPLDEIFRECINMEDAPEDADLYECGSSHVEDTPKALYRILFLCEPKKPIDFSDMYKHPVLLLRSADKRYGVQVYLYKYELGLYFYCPKSEIDGKGSAVHGGWPGADNHVRCSSPVGIAFFDMVKAIIEHEHDVYSGNNFVV